MNTASNPRANRLSAAVRADAAAWVARLHGPNRTTAVEAGLRKWLAEAPEHAAAFELLTDTWEKSAQIRRRPIEQVSSWEFPGFRIRLSRAALAAVTVAVTAVLGTLLYLHNSDVVVTAVGEQRILTLDDGTRIHLNTDTRIMVRYGKNVRRVVLEKGEALFTVASRPGWPFIVTAGNEQIRALGTEFIIRRDDHDLTVTLVEGKVVVDPLTSLFAVDSAASAPAVANPASSRDAVTAALPATAVVTLSPGQRLTFAASGAPAIDRPSLERVSAWQRGQVSFDNTPLAAAVSELNRYNRRQLVVQPGPDTSIQISGIFRAGDSENFARALARTYHLQVQERADQIVLAAPAP